MTGERRARRALDGGGLERVPLSAHGGEARGGRLKWLFVGIACFVAAAWLLWQGFTVGDASDRVGTVFGAGFFVVLGLFGVGLSARPRPAKSFRLINATVMTRAERPTADSWVHLAQTDTTSIGLTLCISLAALGCLSIAVFAGLEAFGVIPQLNTDVSEAGPALGMLFMGALGTALSWLASLLIRRQFRNGTVGARPSGVALGATAVAVNVPGRDVEIPWSQIEHIDLVTTAPSSGGGSGVVMIRITLAPGPVSGRVQMLSGSGYRVPASAIYTALRWYLARPEFRWELGRIEGERRLAAWCTAGRAPSNSQ